MRAESRVMFVFCHILKTVLLEYCYWVWRSNVGIVPLTEMDFWITPENRATNFMALLPTKDPAVKEQVGEITLRPSPDWSCRSAFTTNSGETELYWTVLNCTALYWTVLNCTERYWTVLNCTELYWMVLNGTERYWTVLNFTELYWTVLNCTELYWTVLNGTERLIFAWMLKIALSLAQFLWSY
jgi:hypothetical protein